MPRTIEGKTAVEWCSEGSDLHHLDCYDEAFECYERALIIDPKNAYARIGKCVLLEALARSDEAIECLDCDSGVFERIDQAVQVNSNDAYAWYWKGTATKIVHLLDYDEFDWDDEQLLQELDDEQSQCYNRVLQINPNDPYLWHSVGREFYVLERPNPEVLKCYDRALEIDPSYAYAWYSKGDLFYNGGWYDKAATCYDQATRFMPKFAEAWYWKGGALGYLKRYAQAVECYDRVLQIEPDNDGAWYWKGNALYNLGCRSEALTCFNRAREINPNFPMEIPPC
ncbi:tetratricopeptide repeat protein [Methanoculleus sp. FWC-SCC1]|uniref:Tetratricopeptide repeat protein n=1 Tax=Methanoculleus frigidifontis TaxID=2584085 RepID=A0ABT8M7H1_9EURY|nr:tetratricopeptide repeat protein [Methanoculleus sp. FWC-SCC1]MDN7023839.1 tetratricopeptide repeat protein [Methanoculleus sp. FWC-SCC1]